MSDEPVHRHQLPDGDDEQRLIRLLQHYYPLPLTVFDLADVLDWPANTVRPIVLRLVRDGVLVRISQGNYAAKEGGE